MATTWNGRPAVDIRDAEPDWTPYTQPSAPPGSPNVVMIVWDDVGYGAMDVNGGPIETPSMRRIAERGVTFGNFHTTALCSPTRSSLLNGRNATSNGMACIAEATTGFPGSNGRIPFENGMISEVLGERGWNTYCVGKWHLTPEEEMDASSWKKRWPLGRGFERFYGFLGGETSQWYPDLVHDNHPVEPPASPEDGYHLSKDLADRAIEFVADAQAAAPDKPFFLSFAPGCGHAPHHVPTEWADRYRGRFDQGYEAIRAEILENQKALGLLPEHTTLSSINPHGEPEATGPAGQPWPQPDWVKPWESLSEDERQLFARMAEVDAGFVSYTDHHIGRVLDHLEETGQLDNTIIVAVSDNGSSAEGGPNGSFNENTFFNGVADTMEANLARLDELGTPTSFNHYCSGWAWAFDTPFPYWKRFAGYEGGTADLCVLSWPEGISERGWSGVSTHMPSTSPRRCMTCWAWHRRRSSTATLSPRSRERASLRHSATLGPRGAQRSSLRCSDSARCTATGGSPPQRTHRPRPTGGASTRTCGSSTTWMPTGHRARTSLRTTPSCSPSSSRCGGPKPIDSTACRWTIAPRWSCSRRRGRSPRHHETALAIAQGSRPCPRRSP